MELVAGERSPVRVDGDEAGEAGADHVQLHVGVGGAVRGLPAAAGRPAVADQALDQVEGAFFQHLALALGGPSHDELDAAAVGRGGPEVVEAGRQLSGGAVRHVQSLPEPLDDSE